MAQIQVLYKSSALRRFPNFSSTVKLENGEIPHTRQSRHHPARQLSRREGVIVRSFDDGRRDRPYGHCLVAGIAKYPKKVIRKDSQKMQAKKSRVKVFLKRVNHSHIMPTRYTLDVVTLDVLQSRDKKVTPAKEAKARFQERFKTGKNRWFFSKLRF